MYQYKSTIDSVPNKGTNPGDRFLKTYIETTKNGRRTLEETGKTDIYEYIQQDLEDSKIENIMIRVAKGDLSRLRESEPQYIDATTIPNSMMEVQNLICKSKQEFEKMPSEVRQLFGYSAEEYINEMGTKQFIEKMSPYVEKIEKISMEKNEKEYEKKVREGAKLNYDIAKEQAKLGGEDTNGNDKGN